jgi:hypothetical protein
MGRVERLKKLIGVKVLGVLDFGVNYYDTRKIKLAGQSNGNDFFARPCLVLTMEAAFSPCRPPLRKGSTAAQICTPLSGRSKKPFGGEVPTRIKAVQNLRDLARGVPRKKSGRDRITCVENHTSASRQRLEPVPYEELIPW